MHYKDGTEAKLNDIVKGTGYNVPGVIVGCVVGLTPGSESCNIQVAHILTKEIEDQAFRALEQVHQHYVRKGVAGCAMHDDNRGHTMLATLDLEYGQCDEFELVYRAPE